jgi:hypothetical protein
MPLLAINAMSMIFPRNVDFHEGLPRTANATQCIKGFVLYRALIIMVFNFMTENQS